MENKEIIGKIMLEGRFAVLKLDECKTIEERKMVIDEFGLVLDSIIPKNWCTEKHEPSDERNIVVKRIYFKNLFDDYIYPFPYFELEDGRTLIPSSTMEKPDQIQWWDYQRQLDNLERERKIRNKPKWWEFWK